MQKIKPSDHLVMVFFVRCVYVCLKILTCAKAMQNDREETCYNNAARHWRHVIHKLVNSYVVKWFGGLNTTSSP